MSGGMYVAASGAMLQQMRMDVLSNNLANASTAGFKADNIIFREFDPSLPQESPHTLPGDTGMQGLSPYTPPFDYKTDFTPGPSKMTANPLDVAISGEGFFAVQTPAGEQYTRQGGFQLSGEGTLVTSQGYPVLGQRGEIEVDNGRVVIDEAGNISVDGEIIDTLKVVDFTQPYPLKKTGDTLFIPENENVQPMDAGNFSIRQGYLELSNVNTVRAMTEMIESLRVFESYQKAIRTADDMNAKAVNEVGKVA